MARNLSKDLKRVVAGLCAVLLVGGSVPLQPLNNFVSNTITAKAEDVVGNEFVNYEPTTENDTPSTYDFVKDASGDSGLPGAVYKSNNTGNNTNASTTFTVKPQDGQVVRIYWKTTAYTNSLTNSDTFTITVNGTNYADVRYSSSKKDGYFEIPGTASSAIEGIDVTVSFRQVVYNFMGTNNPNTNVGYVSFQMAQKGAALNFDGLTADTDYYVENNADARPGDTVTIYSLDKLKTDKDYTIMDYEYSPIAFRASNNLTYPYKCTMTIADNAVFEHDETITLTKMTRVNLVVQNATNQYAVVDSSQNQYVEAGSVVYSNVTLVEYLPNGGTPKVELQREEAENSYSYNGGHYNYKYTVKYSEDLAANSTVTLARVNSYGNPHHTEQAPDTLVVDCLGANNNTINTFTIAQIQPKDVYYYGDQFTADDVFIISDANALGISGLSVKKVTVSKDGGDTQQKKFDEYGEYLLTAIVDVTYNGKPISCNITKTVEYAPRLLAGVENSCSEDDDYVGCRFYLRNPVESEDEAAPEFEDIELTVDNGVIVIPKQYFVYNRAKQTPTIVVKNTVNGEEVELTTEEITNTVQPKTVANKAGECYTFDISAVQPEEESEDVANYTGKVDVKWTIEKAPNNVVIEPKSDIVYDGEALDKTDFTFTNETNVFQDSNLKITVKANEGDGMVSPEGDEPYALTADDSQKLLAQVDGAEYTLPDGYTYSVETGYLDEEGIVVGTTIIQPTQDISSIKYEMYDGNYTWRFKDSLGYFYNDNNNVVATEENFNRATVVFNEATNTATIRLFNEAVCEKAQGRSCDAYDITNAGIQKGTITISSDNYETQEMYFTTEIAKKEVTVAPQGIKAEEKYTITWGDLIDDEDILYSQDGVVEKDKPEEGDYNFGLIFTLKDYDFENASNNDVGDYKIVTSDVFAEYNEADNNYILVLPEDYEEKETLTIEPYQLTKDNVTITETEYEYDSQTKKPLIKVIVPYSRKGSEELAEYKLSLGTVDSHADKDAFVKGVRSDSVVSEKNIAIMTDDTTSKNFTAGEGLEFKWYINKGSLTVTVGQVADKEYDGTPVEAPEVTVVNQVNANVDDVTTIQYQKLDAETGEYGEAFDEAPVDAGTYRAVVTAESVNYNQKVEYSNEFTIAKKEVTVELSAVPTLKNYKDMEVDYTVTGIIAEDTDIPSEGTIVIKAGKQDGDSLTNEDLAEIAEVLGDNYTFTYDTVLELADAKLDKVNTTTAYVEGTVKIDPNDYFTAYDEVDDDITERCKVANIDNIDQIGEYDIDVIDTAEDPAVTHKMAKLAVKYKYEEVGDLLDSLPPLDGVTVDDEQAIVDAREAFENLSEEQAAKVDEETIQKLEDYEVALEGAKKAAADKAAAEAVDDLIDEIGEVAFDDESKAKIDAAAEAYDALTDDQKALVENKEALDNAQQAYDDLKAEADKAAADEVAKLINALPAPEAVTKDDGDAIAAAQEAYDVLTDEQKALVDPEVAKKLTDAAEAFDKVNFAIGDVNGDGEINVTDILRIAAHIKHKIVLTDEQLKRADVNGDGNINVTDITKIAAHIKRIKLLK